MIPFLEQIANIINAVIHFIVHGIQMIVAVLVTMLRAITFLFAGIALMPSYVVGIISISVGLAVVLFIINKGSTG